MEVITKQTEPADWVSCVVKLNKIRISMDPLDLIKVIKREHYPLLIVEEVVSSMPNAKILSVLDTNQGLWQIKLDNESSVHSTHP